jgi:hypothetical protein
MSPSLIREWSPGARGGALPNLLRRVHITAALPIPTEDEPDDEELLGLIEGQLTPAQLRRLEEQLQECPYSTDRVAVVRAALAEAGVVLPRRWVVWSSEE